MKHTNVDALSRNPVGLPEDDDDFGRKIQDLRLEPRSLYEVPEGIFSIQNGREYEWLGLRRQVSGLKQHHECCFDINHQRWSGMTQVCMLEVLTDTSQGEDEFPEDEDGLTVERGTGRATSPRSKQDLGMGKAKYYERKQQLELGLVAQELMEDCVLEVHATRTENEEACADGTSSTDVWEDTMCVEFRQARSSRPS
ncbi:unnamed protein product [Sphagnum jensenii]|uniref:Uncharacterized protein n=1 Tax=Sphagnum jensenii TaxID=128206 RepID=A0ABP1A3E9_9BRYO